MAPRPEPSRYRSPLVKSEYTRFPPGTPSDSKYALKNGAYTYMLRTRGMPMRSVARRSINSIRRRALLVHARDGIGSATRSGFLVFQTSFAAISTKFGLAFLTASTPALMPRIASTSSTVPFSQVAIIRRCSSAAFATFDTNLTGAGFASTAMTLSPILTSMNVRRQLFLQKLHRVDSLRVVRYVMRRTASRPMNFVR